MTAVQPMFNPLLAHRLAISSVGMPDPVEFVISEKFLDRGVLYPRQATALKVIFLRDDMLTDFDLEVIEGWETTFRRNGNEGVSPGILQRIQMNKDAGRSWFKEVLAVIGRRGGKGHLGAICSAYILWHFLNRPGGPQTFYGIDRDKTIAAIVFAGKKDQAKANQWGDLNKFVTNAPCFKPYLSKPLAESLTIYSPADLLKIQRQKFDGSKRIEADQASFAITPSASTMMAGRGPASAIIMFDEMAHIIASGASRSAAEIYNAAMPSLDQFGVDGFSYQGSSPWQMQGQFYENWQNSIAMEPDGTPSYPSMMMIQMPSWNVYLDYERAHELPIRPPTTKWIEVTVPTSMLVDGEEVPTTRTEIQEVEEVGECLPPIRSAVQTFDADMQAKERANPDSFAVEYRSHWALSLSSYLDEKKVSEAFEPYDDGTGAKMLTMQPRGPLSRYYKAHADPGSVNDNFAFAMGHVERPPGSRFPHVVIDLLRLWRPGDYEGHIVDYPAVTDDLWDIITKFTPDELTFDQFQSVMMIATLNNKLAEERLPKATLIFEKPATRPLNWKRAELFKSALNLGLIHIPMHKGDGSVDPAGEMAELELRFLELRNGRVDHPTAGPITHNDLSDCLMEVVWALIGEELLEMLESPVMSQVAAMGQGGIETPLPRTQPQDPFSALAQANRGPARSSMGSARGMRRR